MIKKTGNSSYWLDEKMISDLKEVKTSRTNGPHARFDDFPDVIFEETRGIRVIVVCKIDPSW